MEYKILIILAGDTYHGAPHSTQLIKYDSFSSAEKAYNNLLAVKDKKTYHPISEIIKLY